MHLREFIKQLEQIAERVGDVRVRCYNELGIEDGPYTAPEIEVDEESEGAVVSIVPTVEPQ